ncbi:MAG: hypothetical protein CVT79_17795 [Alphaproteobacteria bacterium HGW-Alphaproteobacteria-18]|nr:MAG: hypothetical protein CVT79_17795 [Alphaproteobacteria bacterium HGW-Alphaproteobacteria-18]
MRPGRSLSRLPFMAVLLLAAVSAWLSLPANGDLADGLLDLTRLTARISVFFFLAAFAASALFRFWPTRASCLLLANRRSVGLAFTLSHFIHLGVLIAYFTVSGEDPGLVRIVGGGLGYLFIGLMALTSNDLSVRRLGKRWTWLHTAGGWYIWLIFLNSYLGRTLEGREPVILFGGITALIVLAAFLKLAAKFSAASNRQKI